MSALMAVHAASFIGSGMGKSGKPCARFTASCRFAMRVISRITDSVNVEVLFAACMPEPLSERSEPNRAGGRHRRTARVNPTSAGHLRQSAADKIRRGEPLAILLQCGPDGPLGVACRIAKRYQSPNRILGLRALWTRAGRGTGD